MKAKKRPLDTVDVSELEVDITPHLKTLKLSEPPKHSAGVIAPWVGALVQKLTNNVKVN